MVFSASLGSCILLTRTCCGALELEADDVCEGKMSTNSVLILFKNKKWNLQDVDFHMRGAAKDQALMGVGDAGQYFTETAINAKVEPGFHNARLAQDHLHNFTINLVSENPYFFTIIINKQDDAEK